METEQKEVKLKREEWLPVTMLDLCWKDPQIISLSQCVSLGLTPTHSKLILLKIQSFIRYFQKASLRGYVPFISSSSSAPAFQRVVISNPYWLVHHAFFFFCSFIPQRLVVEGTTMPHERLMLGFSLKDGMKNQRTMGHLPQTKKNFCVCICAYLCLFVT